MKVKAKDIAKAAGVSTTAVSLVMNGKDSRISEATRIKMYISLYGGGKVQK